MNRQTISRLCLWPRRRNAPKAADDGHAIMRIEPAELGRKMVEDRSLDVRATGNGTNGAPALYPHC